MPPLSPAIPPIPLLAATTLAGSLAGRLLAFASPGPGTLLASPLLALGGLLLGQALAGKDAPPLPALLLSPGRPAPSWRRRLPLLATALPLLLAVQGLSLLAGLLFPPTGPTAALPLTPALLASSCLLAPLAEELLYRRLLPQGLSLLGLPGQAAHLLCALLFAAAHLNPRAIPGLFLLALALSWIQARKDTLQAILVHALFNACTLLLLALLP